MRTLATVALLAIITTTSCDDKGGGDSGGGTVEQTGVVSTGDQPTGSGQPTGGGGPNGAPPKSTTSVAVPRTAAGTTDNGRSPTAPGPLAGMYVKAMTADIDNQATCIAPVDEVSGEFSLTCEGFQNKQLIVAIIRKNADGT